MIPYTPPKPADHIPVVDLAGSFAGNAARKAAIAREIHKASRDTGFFYVANHGIEPSVTERAFAEARAFFDLPIASKQAVSAANWPVARGYEQIQSRSLDSGSPPDLMESFYIGREQGPDHVYVQQGVSGYGANQWPPGRPGFRAAFEDYYGQAVGLGHHLMGLLALSLDLEESYFEAIYREVSATLRLHRYPPQPQDARANQLGAGAHTDYGSITILAQDDLGGLEVENAAGEWLRAEPIPGTFVVNNGDMVPALDQRCVPFEHAPGEERIRPRPPFDGAVFQSGLFRARGMRAELPARGRRAALCAMHGGRAYRRDDPPQLRDDKRADKPITNP